MSFSIAKFGGTSMATAEVAKKSVQVLKDRPRNLGVCDFSYRWQHKIFAANGP